METRARYLLIGLFTLVVAGMGFGFVYWLKNAGSLGERVAFQVRFTSAVPGLRPGSSVLFNGIRVGEVTALALSPENPRDVLATIMVERSTPVRADTVASVEAPGLMASPSITLRGGAADAPPLATTPGRPAVIAADTLAGTDTMALAREVLRHIDQVVVENAEPLKATIANVRTFSEALARNSDKIDSLLTAIERMTGAGPEKPGPTVYDLVAPASFAGLAAPPTAQLLVMEPTAVVALDTQRIVRRGAVSQPYPDSQWADSIPKLTLARLVQSFENAKFPGVARSLDGFAQDYQLAIDIRKFWVTTGTGAPQAQIEFGAKVMASGGKIAATRLFRAEVALKEDSAAGAAAAMNEAFTQTVTELVTWTAGAM